MTRSPWTGRYCKPPHPTALANANKSRLRMLGVPLHRLARSVARQRRLQEGEKKGATTDFHGKRFNNLIHGRCHDPDASLARGSKVHPALLRYRGHVPMDNRHPKGFVGFMGWQGVTPHVARNTNRVGRLAIE